MNAKSRLAETLHWMASSCMDASPAECERLNIDHGTVIPKVSGYVYDDLLAAAEMIESLRPSREPAVVGEDRLRIALQQIAAETSAASATDAADRFQRIAREALAATPAAPEGAPQEAVAWQVRTELGGWWSGWSQVQSAGEMEHMLGRYRELGQQAEGRALYTHPTPQPAAGVDVVPVSVALSAVEHVGAANYDSRVAEARRWIREAALAPPAPGAE